MILRTWTTGLLLLVSGLNLIRGATPPRTDCYGDPLPEGAIARLGTVRLRHGMGAYCVVFSPDGKTVASASADGTVRLWDPRSGRELKQFGKKMDRMASIAFSPDGRRLAAVGDGGLYAWQVATGHEALRYAGPGEFVAFADGGKAIVRGSGKRKIIDVLRFEGGETEELQNANGYFVLEGGIAPQFPIAVSSSGRWVVGQDSFWDLTTGKKQPWNLDPGWDETTRFAFTSSGTILAGTTRGKVRLIEFASGRSIGEILGVSGFIAFSPDGRTLVSRGGSDHTVCLVDVATGEVRQRLAGHQGTVNAASFSPDGKLLATASDDHTVLIWELNAERVRVRHSPETLGKLWADLDAVNPATAYRALWALADDPEQTPAFLRDRVRPLFVADPQRIVGWITDLDSDDFDVRDQARLDLERLCDRAEPALRRALAGTPSVEARHQILALLERLETANGFTAQRRLLRVVETLEMIGTPEARRELQYLADEAPVAWLKQEAKAALRRVASRAAAP